MILQSCILLICGFTLWVTAYIASTIGRSIVVQNQNVQEAVNAITEQLVKAQREVVAKIADVQAQLDAANVPAEVVDLSALTEAAQRLDDVVPDPAPEAPTDVVEEVVAEVVPEA